MTKLHRTQTQFISFVLFVLTINSILCEKTDDENVVFENEDHTEYGTDYGEDVAKPIFRERRGQRRRQRLAAAVCREVVNLNFCWNQHDRCDHIQANETKFHLINDNAQTVWHCNCEQEFFDCLHRINSTLSNHIGELYFSQSAHHRCYRNDYKIFDCIEFDVSAGGMTHRCVRYMLLLKPSITNQWFDLPFYSGKPMKTALFAVKDGRW